MTDWIFVTGGTGFLGQHLVPRLLQSGYSLRLLVRRQSDVTGLPEDALQKKRLELVKGDITDRACVRAAMQGCRYVVHAAGHFRLWGPKETFERDNVLGTENVAEASAQAGVERLVYVSTLAVIGQPPAGEMIDEKTRCQPIDAYQRSKYKAELKVRGLVRAGALQAVILRPGAFYGPGSRYGFNRLFIEEPMRGWRVQVDGGHRLIFPAYVKDVARAAALALDCACGNGRPAAEIYNICNRPVSHAQINRIVSNCLGISTRRLNLPRGLVLATAGLMELLATRTGREPFYPLNLRHYVFHDWLVSNEKARQELGLIPTSLEEGLRATVAWYQDQNKRGRR